MLAVEAGPVKRSPIRWMGGKHYQAARILEFLVQAPHSRYIEVFGGAASVMLRKPPCRIEVYNDRDGDLCNFWMVCRDHPEELQAALDSLLYSRELYYRWGREAMPEDSLERAVRFFYILRSAHGGVLPRGDAGTGLSGWAHATKSLKAGGLAATFRSAIALLGAVSARLRHVQIDCRDWRDILRSYDGPDALFYLDPPYVLEGGCYRGAAWSEDDHREMAERLNRMQGFAAVSYYPHPLVDECYAGWRRVEYEHIQRASSNPNRPRHAELLLLNYGADGRRLS